MRCAQELAEAIAQARPVVIACEPTPEGVLAGVGITYLAHAREGQVRLASVRGLQPQLGEQVVRVPSASDEVVGFAERVLAGFSRKVTQGCRKRRKGGCPATCDNACVRRIVLATASDSADMPELVHRYMRLGFAVGPKVRHLIADPRVAEFDALARSVLNECEHARQFVRFSHLADGSFVASFSTKANVIPLVASHFSARMGTERFCLVDPVHRVAAFHDSGQKGCQIVLLDAALARDLAHRNDLADDEAYVRAMWQRFYRGTTIPGRDRSQRGYDLRTSWMPQRFWSGLSELDEPVEATPRIPARYAGEGALPSTTD